MKTKDQVLLEAAYQKVLNVKPFDYNKLNLDKLDNDDLRQIALKNPAIIKDMREWMLDLIDSGMYADNPTENDVMSLNPEEVISWVKSELPNRDLKEFFLNSRSVS
jgi:hypothetical protein